MDIGTNSKPTNALPPNGPPPPPKTCPEAAVNLNMSQAHVLRYVFLVLLSFLVSHLFLSSMTPISLDAETPVNGDIVDNGGKQTGSSM